MNTNKLKEKLNNLNPFSGSEWLEVPDAKTLWLILFSYLNVLFNSAPDQMTLDELGTEINSQHEQCQKYPGMGLLYARNAGEWLLEAKAKLQPDEWQRWLNTNCKFSERTAETYMQMAKGWPGFRVAVKKDAKTESTISYSPEVAAILESLSPFSNSEDTPVAVGMVENSEVIESSELSPDIDIEYPVIFENSAVIESAELSPDIEIEPPVIVENSEVIEADDLASDIEIESLVIVDNLEVIEPANLSSDIEIESPVIADNSEVIESGDLSADIEIESPVIADNLEVIEPANLSPDIEIKFPVIVENLEVIDSADLSPDIEIESPVIVEDLEVNESADLSPNIESISAVSVEVLEAIEPVKVSANIKSESPIVVEALEVIDIADIAVNIESELPNIPISKGKKEDSKSIKQVDVVTSNSSEVEKCDREVIIFFIPGNVVPKARPRVTGNGTYMPQRYRAWRNMAEVEIYTQLSGRDLTTLPIKKASILMRFVGKHRTNSDLDNLAGACLDALTMNGAGVLLDDRISCVSKLSVEYLPDTKNTGVWIEITPVD